MVSVSVPMQFVVKEGSGIISVNGGAAHQADVGDLMIIATFGDFTKLETNAHKPTFVLQIRQYCKSHGKLYSSPNPKAQ